MCLAMCEFKCKLCEVSDRHQFNLIRLHYVGLTETLLHDTASCVTYRTGLWQDMSVHGGQ